MADHGLFDSAGFTRRHVRDGGPNRTRVGRRRQLSPPFPPGHRPTVGRACDADPPHNSAARKESSSARRRGLSSTPATIGWLRPMLLLPTDWRNWTDDEWQAVLAHEIEHVRRNDFAAWMAAQIGIALHFYHPLVHGLAARFGCSKNWRPTRPRPAWLGGQRKYVTMLAAMALRQADAVAAWPATLFFPIPKRSSGESKCCTDPSRWAATFLAPSFS